MLLIRGNIRESFKGFSMLLVGGLDVFPRVLFFAGPLILLGISVAFSFKAGLFNIGTPGQYVMGGITALYLANFFPPIPVVHLLVCILGAIIVGALWGMIPGLLKAFFNISEVITSIMLNYVGTYLTYILVLYPPIYNQESAQVKINFSSTAKLPLINFFGTQLDIGILIAIFMAIITLIVLYKTKFGYKIIAVGSSSKASRYAGMNTKALVVIAMAISGGLAGLAAVLSYLPISPSAVMRPEIGIKSIGFDGIFISLIGASNPIGVIASGIFVSYLRQGSNKTQLYGFTLETVDIVIGIVIYLIAIQSFITKYLSKIGYFFKKLFGKSVPDEKTTLIEVDTSVQEEEE
jgi:simple sugar transport system permease protein